MKWHLPHKMRSFSSVFQIYSISLILFSASALVITFLVLEFRNYNKNTAKGKQRFLEYQKFIIKNEVEKTFDYIDQTRTSLDEEMKQNIKERVDEAWEINKNIYAENKDHLSKEKIKKMVKTYSVQYVFFTDAVIILFIQRTEQMSSI